ncbi:hypothetical protein UFOVP190_13 [uncultured Caudovirales phage]|uniref:Uncharacterized protein n=1 Tax=uncultured Caudovirales phage TaxID=2100421 RepID=A0A6J7WGC4_9CAUD|nr:hypothetical protein UFOVP190_13 [uncultured Caudovirales phage]
MIKFDEKVYSLPMYEGGHAMTGPKCSYWHNFFWVCNGNKKIIRSELALQGGEMDSGHLCFAKEQDAAWFKLRWS